MILERLTSVQIPHSTRYKPKCGQTKLTTKSCSTRLSDVDDGRDTQEKDELRAHLFQKHCLGFTLFLSVFFSRQILWKRVKTGKLEIVFRKDQKESHYHRRRAPQNKPTSPFSFTPRSKQCFSISKSKLLTTELAVSEGADWPNVELRIRCKL